MNDNDKTIHDFDFNLICEYFSGLERQGPGNPSITRKALSFIDNLNENSKIADIGCGTGGQTIVLADNIKGHITAIDLFPKFIDILNSNIKKRNYESRISTLVTSMEKLPFGEDELDLIWSEGAIYNIGFERGINEWMNYLKKGGYIAVSEATWFTETRPDEIAKFWNDAYPEIDTISAKIKQMERAGYKVTSHFILPDSCWLNDFYKPMPVVQKKFLNKYKENKMAQELIESQLHEQELYNKYKEYYGYVFYIGQKL